MRREQWCSTPLPFLLIRRWKSACPDAKPLITNSFLGYITLILWKRCHSLCGSLISLNVEVFISKKSLCNVAYHLKSRSASCNIYLLYNRTFLLVVFQSKFYKRIYIGYIQSLVKNNWMIDLIIKVIYDGEWFWWFNQTFNQKSWKLWKNPSSIFAIFTIQIVNIIEKAN